MASGKQHRRAAIIIAAPCAIWAGAITKDWIVGLGVGLGCLLGIPLNSDLDILEAVTPKSVRMVSLILWAAIWYGFVLEVWS